MTVSVPDAAAGAAAVGLLAAVGAAWGVQAVTTSKNNRTIVEVIFQFIACSCFANLIARWPPDSFPEALNFCPPGEPVAGLPQTGPLKTGRKKVNLIYPSPRGNRR
jgi:hypothetical protein